MAVGLADLLGSDLLLLGALEHLPEAESLVASSRGDGGAVGAEREVEHAAGVAAELGHADHGGILPDDELVLREAVRRDELALVGVPLQSAHLRAGVDRVEARAGGAAPGADAAVRGAAARGEETLLPGAPSDGLDGGLVGVERELGGSRARVPDVEEVVVACAAYSERDVHAEGARVRTARGELETVGGPLEAADLLSVTLEGGNVVLGDADIVVEDLAVTAAGAEEVAVPGEGTDWVR